MADARNIQLGVCSVTYKGTNLGHTIGGVTVTYKPDYHETKVDQTGTSVAKLFLVGESMEADFDLAEWTLANLEVAIAQGTQVGDDSVSIGSYAGKNVTLTAGLLLLHPIVNAATNYNDDVAIYKGVVTGDVKIEHNNKGEKVIPIKIIATVDETRTDGNLLAYIGDSIS